MSRWLNLTKENPYASWLSKDNKKNNALRETQRHCGEWLAKRGFLGYLIAELLLNYLGKNAGYTA